jgi:hypothetical protein
MDGSRIRWVAIGAAMACAVLYLSIGIGVLTVGRSTQDATTNLFGFGMLMGAVYLATAVALWRFKGRLALAMIAGFQLVPLLGYVAFASYREPPFELWGLLIKVGQAGVLIAAAVLALRVGATATSQPPQAKGHPA